MALLRGRTSVAKASRLWPSLYYVQPHRPWLPQRRMFAYSTTLSTSDPFIYANLNKAILDNGQDLRPPMSFPEEDPSVEETEANQEETGAKQEETEVKQEAAQTKKRSHKSGSLRERLGSGSKSISKGPDASGAEKSKRTGRWVLGQPSTKPMRTRFAPSPTGDMHLGSLRTALVNQVVAKATDGGTFILRIEDTDQSRTVVNSQKTIVEDLKWLGLEWSEGPDIGGPCGPYLQSERLHIYKPYVERLIDQGHAYRCFCKPEDIREQNEQALLAGQSTSYPKTCRHVSAAESSERASKNEPYAVRFKGDHFGVIGFKDGIKGKFQKSEPEEDFIIWKTDGFPTYHLANVVDDHLMGITHVIRGDEWLVSTPKHLALYRALEWDPPAFSHLPLLFQEDGKKLSKRNKASSVQTYRQDGISSLGMMHWLASMSFKQARTRGSSPTVAGLSEQPTISLSSANATVRADGHQIEQIERKLTKEIVEDYAGETDEFKNIMYRNVLQSLWFPAIQDMMRFTEEGATFPSGSTDPAEWKQKLELVVCLQSVAKTALTAPITYKYLFKIFNLLKQRPHGTLRELLADSPWLIWRKPVAFQRRALAKLTKEYDNIDPGLLGSHISWLSKMHDPDNGFQEWKSYLNPNNPDQDPFAWLQDQKDQQVLHDEGRERTQQERNQWLSRCYEVDRFVMTGATNPSYPAKLTISMLGLKECRVRLELAQGLYEELRVGGDDLAQRWIEEADALLEEARSSKADETKPLETELEEETISQETKPQEETKAQ